jgi:hypothetical protein
MTTRTPLLKRLPFYPLLKQAGHYPDYWWWKLRGEPRRIPHLVKQRTVLEYAQRFGFRTLVETGTYYGEMIAAVGSRFQRIYSIELDPTLAAQAKARFRKSPNVRIVEGDSQTIVPLLVPTLHEPCLFWLDAGYCGWARATGASNRLGTEMHSILADTRHRHVILMDDADGVEQLEELLASLRASYADREVEIARNIIRITPRQDTQRL